jgi:hypothetical protein
MFFLEIAAGVLLGLAIGVFLAEMDIKRGIHLRSMGGTKQRKQLRRNYRLIGLAALAIWLAIVIPTQLHWSGWPGAAGALGGIILFNLIENRMTRYIG